MFKYYILIFHVILRNPFNFCGIYLSIVRSMTIRIMKMYFKYWPKPRNLSRLFTGTQTQVVMNVQTYWNYSKSIICNWKSTLAHMVECIYSHSIIIMAITKSWQKPRKKKMKVFLPFTEWWEDQEYRRFKLGITCIKKKSQNSRHTNGENLHSSYKWITVTSLLANRST